MMRIALLPLLSLLLFVQAIGFSPQSVDIPQQATKLEDPPWIKEVATQRIVYGVSGMEKIRARKDLTYKRVADTELKMDVYLTPESSAGDMLQLVVDIGNSQCATLRVISLLESCQS